MLLFDYFRDLKDAMYMKTYKGNESNTHQTKK